MPKVGEKEKKGILYVYYICIVVKNKFIKLFKFFYQHLSTNYLYYFKTVQRMRYVLTIIH